MVAGRLIAAGLCIVACTGASPRPRSAGDLAASILARPVFQAGRRPGLAAASRGVVAGFEQPRLVGTLVTPRRRVAIFATPGTGQPVVVGEGGQAGTVGVTAIRPGEVETDGPGGAVLFRVGVGGAAHVSGLPLPQPAATTAFALHAQGGNEQQPE